MNESLMSGAGREGSPRTIHQVMELVLPWVAFLVLLGWGWRVDDLFRSVPGYQDALEVLWGIEWYGEHLMDRDLLVYPLLFHPAGWRVATFAYGPGVFVPLLPLYHWGGAAFAYNAGALLSLFVALAGMFRLARRFTPSALAATVAALLYTFWGFRWLRIFGHLNILFGSALLPWIAWSFDRACRVAPRRWRSFALAGVLWSATVVCSLYFVWLGGLLLLAWWLGCWSERRERRVALLGGLGLTVVLAALLSAPTLILFLRGYAAAGASSYDVDHLNAWGASLNSLPIPSVGHPWLGKVAMAIYQGPVDESGVVNLGLMGSAAAVLGIIGVRHQQGRRSLLLTLGLGLILGLGLTLKWDGRVVRCELLRPVTAAVWWVGHHLKPGLFPAEAVPARLDAAIPLPGLLLAALMPFWEGARTVSRFTLVAAPAFFTLIARGIQRLRSPVVTWLVAALLVIEVVPPPSSSAQFPPPGHPAFDWVREETPAETGVVDLYAAFPDVLMLPIRGETLWATRLHRRATVAGTSGVWPGHTRSLFLWLLEHPRPLQGGDFASLLRAYDADYVLLHMQSDAEWQHLEEAQRNPSLEVIECFDPPAATSPWPYPICVLHILPSSLPVELMLREGWSPPEAWGAWATGTWSHARWVGTARESQRLAWEAFPYCIPGEQQTLSVTVRGATLFTHRWTDCAPASGEVVIPASMVEVGWNDIYFHYGYAARPVEVTSGANPDPRALSVGFTRLQIEEVE